jgi:alcohol dehydrogenase YqhD (iron-dependent ADH family)
LLAGIAHTKHGNHIANLHRKKQAFLGSTLAGYVVSSLNPSGFGFMKSMTDVERHAELMYAETLYEKALLGIVYSGDWLSFIKEA